MATITAENLKDIFLEDVSAKFSIADENGGIPSLNLYAFIHTLFNIAHRTEKMIESSNLFFSRLEREKMGTLDSSENNLLATLKLKQKIRQEKYGISNEDESPNYKLMEENPYAQRALHFNLKKEEADEWFKHPDTRIISDIFTLLYQNTFVLQHDDQDGVPFQEMFYEVGYFPTSPQKRESWLNHYSESRHPAYMLLQLRLEEIYLNAISKAFPRQYQNYGDSPEAGYHARENLDRYTENEILFTPEILNVDEINETKWNLLSSDQQKCIFMLAFASFNTSLLLKVSEFSGNPLFELIKKSDPFVIYYAFQLQQLSFAMIETFQNSLIQSQQEGILKNWGINNIYRNERLLDIVLDFYGKLGFLDNLMTLIADKIHTYEINNNIDSTASESFDTFANMVALNEYI